MDPQSLLTDDDLQQLRTHGLSADEARRQLEILRRGPTRVVLDRACTVGDGISRIADAEYDTLAKEHREASAAGRWTKFVPASGAASRMFSFTTPDDRQRLCDHLPRFAFGAALTEVLDRDPSNRSGIIDPARAVETLLSPSGLGFAEIPKGLVPFHREAMACHTPFEDHLLEAAACFCTAEGRCLAHFTVSAEHRSRFAAALADYQAGHREVSYDVGFSLQKPSTDTLALSAEGRPLHGDYGTLALRPGGHGALIENLGDLNADCVFVKNIDNVAHVSKQAVSRQWIQILGGYLLRIQRAVHHHLVALDAGPSADAVAQAGQFYQKAFAETAELSPSAGLDQQRTLLRGLLHRPLRVCGMVRNEGEPGGGPFWVRRPDGRVSVQIVESVEVDLEDPHQAELLRSATHFNPVFMALAVRDHRGVPLPLSRFVDASRSILTEKRVGACMATVLERPGLWNGAMADWNSVFVEVPKEVFAPVKTVFDLLRDEHQPVE